VNGTVVRACGLATAGMLTVLGLFHVLWAAGIKAGSTAALPERDGRPLFQPGRASTLMVAGGLFGGALTLLARLGLVRTPLPARYPMWGCWLLATLFGLRAIGEFQYVGLFKRVRGTAFARWDTRLYTPLCIVISLGSALVASERDGSRQ
jgi:hypothetical protein